MCEDGGDSTLGSLLFSTDVLSPQEVLTVIVLNENWKNNMKAAYGLVIIIQSIDVFRLGGLLPYFRPCDDTLENSSFQIFK